LDKDRPKNVFTTNFVTHKYDNESNNFSVVLLIFTCRLVFIHALIILLETKLQTFVKYVLPQITRRYPVKMH
jgi:type IV secretory pathway TrbL component